MAWAATRGIALDAGALAPRAGATSQFLPHWPPPGWLPTGFSGEPEARLYWRCFAGISPNTPFFDSAARTAAARPLNRLLRIETPLLDSTSIPQPPAGFIFHMSRCGSTLVSQMLGAAPGHVAISEAPAIDAVVRHGFADTQAHENALRAIIHAYGRAGRLFVKLDAWHTRALPLIRRAFPGTPWLFLYRDPVEVIVSHLRRRGGHVAGAVPLAWFGLKPEDAVLPPPEFVARILATICQGAITHDRGEGLFVNYAELPQAFFTRILPHFGVAPDAAFRAAMERAAKRDAKEPTASFRPDSEAKQREADADLRATADRYLGPLFAQLEVRRAAA